MSFSMLERFLRKSLVILLGIVILILTLISVTILKFKDDSLNSILISNVDCMNINYNDNELLAEKSLVTSLKIKTACFCQNNINSQGAENTAKLSLSDNSFPCSNYVDIYNSYNIYKILIAFFIPILNLVLNNLKSSIN